jgi:hypothetical protein
MEASLTPLGFTIFVAIIAGYIFVKEYTKDKN